MPIGVYERIDGVNNNRLGIKASKLTRLRISKSKSGKNHPMYGKHHSKKTIDRIREGNVGKFVSKKTCNKISKSLKGKHASKATRLKLSNIMMNRKMSNSWRKKLSDSAKQQHIRGNFVIAFKYKNTRPELMIKFILRIHKIKFIHQYQINSYLADFYLPEYNLIVEADGEYWHKDKKKDTHRDYIMRKLGYNVLRLKGKKIKLSPNCCLCRIIKAIEASK